jgi:hypothetical protein
MVSVKNAVTPQFQQKMGEGRVLSKNQFFYDMFHPANIGHTIMADCLGYLFDEVTNKNKSKEEEFFDRTHELLLQKPVVGNTFDGIKLLDKKDNFEKAEIDCGGFTETDTILQSVEMDLNLTHTPEFPYNWMFDGSRPEQAYFQIKIECRALVLVFKDSGETGVARADVYVDGEKVRTADPYVNGWLHCNPIIILNETETKEHMIRIQIVDGDEQKRFTILGFGYVE